MYDYFKASSYRLWSPVMFFFRYPILRRTRSSSSWYGLDTPSQLIPTYKRSRSNAEPAYRPHVVDTPDLVRIQKGQKLRKLITVYSGLIYSTGPSSSAPKESTLSTTGIQPLPHHHHCHQHIPSTLLFFSPGTPLQSPSHQRKPSPHLDLLDRIEFLPDSIQAIHHQMLAPI